MSTGKAPALYHVRARSLTSKLLDLDSSPACPSPPPFRSRSHASVPFLWEDAPGKPKLRAPRPTALLLPSASPAPVLADGGATAARVAGGHEDGAPAHARPVLLKLKLPPRLQAAEHPLSSPKTVLQGPYFGGGGNKPPRPLRRIARTASCQMNLRAGGGLFVWRKGAATATASAGSKEGGHCQLYAVAPDASCCSPAASSASSSSSSSMSYFFDDHSRRQADGREDSEDGEAGADGGKGSVRITRFRRNRSLPTMSRSHLWKKDARNFTVTSPEATRTNPELGGGVRPLAPHILSSAITETMLCSCSMWVGFMIYVSICTFIDMFMEYIVFKNAHDDIMFLEAMLEPIQALLLGMSKIEELDERDKYWMKYMQKLSQDIDYSISVFMLLGFGYDKTVKPKGFKSFINRTGNLWTFIRFRHEILPEINNLVELVNELWQRFGRCKVDYDLFEATKFLYLESFFVGRAGQDLVNLLTFLLEEYKLFKSACDKTVFLKPKVETINAFLLKMSQVEGPDGQDKYRMNKMQKLSHDIQDSINDFMLCVYDNPTKPKGFKGFIIRSTNLLKYINTNRAILKKVNYLQALVIEVWQRHARYKVDYNIAKASNSRSMEHDVLEHILDGTKEPTNLPFELLKSITRNFSEDREIGRGGFGIVYKGVLPNEIVAVKRFFSHHTIDEKIFYREVNSLLNVNHENAVRFLGYCASTEHFAMKIEGSREYIYPEIRERLLCFEHIGNGSLHEYITDELRGLDWNRRYQIIKQICDGLLYLHKEKHIFHMDLKPDNILLDNHMVVKIADFGLSRLDEKSQTMDANRCVTLGYCCPEYLLGGKMSVRSDIYSLGVIIIELVTGCKDIPENSNIRPHWDDDMLGIEPLKLHFHFEPNKQISCLLQLANDTTASIAFSIQSVSPMPYCIQPNKGIVPPLSSCAVDITLQSQSKPPKDMQYLGEFVVRSTKVADGVTTGEITSDMFSKLSGEVVDEVNVDVVFDSHC
ncbi:unnamed protein product [Triticum turgidum subsp. durum]|uniref:non-specific serine/threonine protein kinase n=1 Tax=Triticum turgidum subsp. durum TaxID=4567 RepID=A0A9R1QYP3_TRITD|nr:unnamed protein product [Triticum turgidum subsp. durum]